MKSLKWNWQWPRRPTSIDETSIKLINNIFLWEYSRTILLLNYLSQNQFSGVQSFLSMFAVYKNASLPMRGKKCCERAIQFVQLFLAGSVFPKFSSKVEKEYRGEEKQSQRYGATFPGGKS